MGDIESQNQAAYAWFTRMQGSDADAHRAAFDAWRANPEHQAIYDRLMDQFDEAGVLSQSRLAGLRVAPPSQAKRRRQALVGAIAAVAVVAVGVAGWVAIRHDGVNGQGPTSYATAVGEIRTVALTGRQSLTLDTNTLVSQGGSQLRLERGRVRATATDAPLHVDLGVARVELRGGTSDIAQTPSGDFEVAALSGAVQVTTRRPGATLQTIRLRPGERLTLTAGVFEGPSPDPGVAKDWPQGLASFDEAPLSEVIAQANRYGGPAIRLAEPSLGQLKVTGAFKVTRTEPLAQALAAAFHLTLVRAPNGDLVLSRAAA